MGRARSLLPREEEKEGRGRRERDREREKRGFFCFFAAASDGERKILFRFKKRERVL